MQRRLFLTSLLTTFLFLSGCFPSLGPFYSEGQPVFDPDLIGRWKSGESDDDYAIVELSRLPDTNAYRMTVFEDEKVQTVLTGSLFTAGDTTFLDVTVDIDDWKMGDADQSWCSRLQFRELTLPIHQLYRVERTADEVKLYLGNIDWLEEHLRLRPGELQHLSLEGHLDFSDYLLTDTPETLQAFFAKHHQQAFDFTVSVYTRVSSAPEGKSGT